MKNKPATVRKVIVACCVSFSLAGCATLPRSGPDDQAIVKGASTTRGAVDRQSVDTKYALIDISEDVVSYFERTLLTSFAPGFKGASSSPASINVGVGDTVKLTIFEADVGGLFIPEEGGSRTGNFIELPEQTIDSSGTISVPYVGRVRAAGLSPGAIERQITEALTNKAIEPQVVVSITNSNSSQITVIGEVDKSQKVDVSAQGDRLLDVLARAGGITSPAEETYVTVTRKGRKSRVLFKHIIDNPQENIYLRPGDEIFVDRERRTFVAIGATGLLGRVDFSESDLSLAEAIGEVGGLNDGTADPSQVFIYRNVAYDTLHKLGLDLSEFSSKMVPTVLRINLRDPSALFRAQKFAMQDGDVLYVSNADSVEILKVLGFVSDVTGASNSIVNNVNGTKTGIESLSD